MVPQRGGAPMRRTATAHWDWAVLDLWTPPGVDCNQAVPPKKYPQIDPTIVDMDVVTVL